MPRKLTAVSTAWIFISTLLAVFFHTSSIAQTRSIDSLKSLIATAKDDTDMVFNLVELSWQLSGTEDYNGTYLYANKALALSEKLQHKPSIGYSLNNLGAICGRKGDYPRALEYNLRAIKVNEETGNKKGLARSYNVIGNIYDLLQERDKALTYHRLALSLNREIGARNGIAISLNNIGIVLEQMGNYKEAFDCYTESLKIKEELKNKGGIAASYDNLGNLFLEKGFEDFDKAYDFHSRALKLRFELGDKNGTASSYINLGRVLLAKGDLAGAKSNISKGLVLAGELRSRLPHKSAYDLLHQVAMKQNNHPEALKNYKLFILYRDSLMNEENTRETVRKQMQFDFDKEQAADSIRNAERLKQEELKHEQEISQQKIYTYGGGIGFLLMLTVAGVSFRAFRNKQRANAIITGQKQLVEAKQREILDSIYYAKRIQESLLPTEKYIDRELKKLK